MDSRLTSAGQYRPRRELPHRARGRVGRFRHHLRGRGPEAAHASRAEGVLSARLRRPRLDHERQAQVRPARQDVPVGALQLPAGGAHARPLRAPEHRARHARVRGQLDRLHGDALRAGAELRRLAERSRAAADPGGARSHQCAAARRAAEDARRKLPAPGHRARQHHRAPGRKPGAARFRRRAPGRGRDEPDAHRRRQGRLLPARAVFHGQPPAGPVVGPVCAGRHTVSSRHRADSRGSGVARGRGSHAAGGAGREGHVPSGLPRRHRRLPQGPALGAAPVGGTAAPDAAR